MSDIAAILWGAAGSSGLGLLRGAIAVLGGLVLAWDARLTSRRGADRYRRWCDVLLAALGALAFICWWNFGLFHPSAGFVHVNDQYHYYLGAKYSPELGYTRLYDCAAVAETEDGHGARVFSRWTRNLVTNQLEKPASVLFEPARCKAHFTPARWQLFKQDVAWFRAHPYPWLWDRVQVDHGYNATPVWAIAGRLLTHQGPASDRQILLLALLDPALLIAMWAAVCWAFGWRTACVAILWWGTNYLSRFTWTGGGFLRADWLAATVVGICLVKRGWHFAGGFALAGAALLRVFPVVVIAALALKAVVGFCRARSISTEPAHRAFGLGVILGALVLVPLSLVVAGRGLDGGVRTWQEFAANSRKHYSTPVINNVGASVLAAYSSATRMAVLSRYWIETPTDSWAEARRRTFAQRAPVFWGVVGAVILLLARAVRNQPDWIALTLGVAFMPIAFELTCYYYAVLLALGFLWLHCRWIGIGLCVLSALTNVVPAVFGMSDDIHATISALIVVFVLAVMSTFAGRDAASFAVFQETRAH
jgi:hypothetical protein